MTERRLPGAAAEAPPTAPDAGSGPGPDASLGAGTDPGLDRWLRRATGLLAGAGVETPRADAELLTAHVLGTTRGRAAALALSGYRLNEEQAADLGRLVAARADRTPLQHLTGTVTFRTAELVVGPGVFLPRPETEIVAGLAIEALRATWDHGLLPGGEASGGLVAHRPVAVDLCTGSGAIAAALAEEVPEARVHAVELDPQAGRWARRNLEHRAVAVHQADAATALAELDGRVDVVVSNPPYVPEGRRVTQAEAGQDPALALYGGGADGMGLPTVVITAAARLLRPGGVLVIEHDETQPETVAALLGEHGSFTDIALHADLTGRPRCTVATRAATPGATDPTSQDGRMSP